MKITAIKQQVKRSNRYSVFVDGKYAFSFSDSALLKSGLVSGQELTEAEIKHFKRASEDDKLYNNALAYATLRPRSEWEMDQYLRRKKSTAEQSKEILRRLRNLGLLDDSAFARSWIANRRLLKPMSSRKLAQELRAKRVSDDIITSALGEDDTDEQAVLAELITRKRKQTRYQDDQKLMQYLAGQGFGYGEIKTALTGVEPDGV